MSQVWFTSDSHFGHANIINFVNQDGYKIRPFPSVEAMDEYMVECWNSVVGKYDRVYHLGDVVINKSALQVLPRLKGKVILIKGNHDIFKPQEYLKYFEDIRSYKMYPAHGIICSHIPVHAGQLDHRFKFNLHGHVHQNTLPDARYINLCVEKTNYTPVSLEQILETIKNDS